MRQADARGINNRFAYMMSSSVRVFAQVEFAKSTEGDLRSIHHYYLF
jgi:hypothetical protein